MTIRTVALAAAALCAFVSAEASAQSYYARERISTPSAATPAVTPPPAPKTISCEPFVAGRWNGDAPGSVYHDLGSIPTTQAAYDTCAAFAKSNGKPGICIHFAAPGRQTYYIENGGFSSVNNNHLGASCTLG